jgi:hypothetical protein
MDCTKTERLFLLSHIKITIDKMTTLDHYRDLLKEEIELYNEIYEKYLKSFSLISQY